MKGELVGLIPAAGVARRVSPLPGSKELFPIGFQKIEVDGHIRLHPKVVSQYLLDNMIQAGARKVWIVLGRGKWDIMHYYGDGSDFGGQIAYLLMDRPWGMPYTLDQAWHWLNQDTVLFGMPDTIFTPPDAFGRMLARHVETGADVTLGVFPTQQPQRFCPVVVDEQSRVLSMTDKPSHTDVMNTWGCACWSPRFTEFMHDFLSSIAHPSTGQGSIPSEEPGAQAARAAEVVLAYVFQAAIAGGLEMQSVFFREGEYIDVGTPDDLVIAVQRFSSR